MDKRKIFISFVIILLAGIGLITYTGLKHKDIETVSAAISPDIEDITANYDGYFGEFTVKDFDTVKAGDVIAKINIKAIKNPCQEGLKAQNKEATAEYTDAAMMYKDGVITKEQYDSSLDKYKKITTNRCSTDKNEIKDIIAINSGKIVLKNIENGDKITKETVIAQLQENTNNVKAYFSPKYKKRIKVGDKAEIVIIKYPEKTFTADVTNIESIDIFGLSTKLKINEDLSELNLKNEDAVMVKILK